METDDETTSCESGEYLCSLTSPTAMPRVLRSGIASSTNFPTFDSPLSVVSDDGPSENADERRASIDFGLSSAAILFVSVDSGELELYRIPRRAGPSLLAVTVYRLRVDTGVSFPSVKA